MDEIDVRLLKHLQENARITVSQLSQILNLSRPSVTERLRRLEEREIILGFTARVSPAGVGRNVLVIIEIGQLNVACHKFESFVAADPDILECHRVTGTFSYMMKAAVPSMAHLELLVDRLIPFGRVTTSVVLSTPVAFRPIVPAQDSSS
jgi:Lrp/AsnC family transcriptional regulator, leucine-responsive regulatory protein